MALLTSRVSTLKELDDLARAVVPRQVGALGLDTVGGAHDAVPRQVGAAIRVDTVGGSRAVVPRQVGALGLDTVGGAHDAVPRQVGAALGLDTVAGAPRRRIQVLRMGSVADAPVFVDIIREKAATAGWVCDDLPFVEKTAAFAMILAKLGDEIIPKLKRNPADKATLRLLRGRGEAARRIRTNRRRLVKGTVIARLAGTLSNRVDRLARVVLSNKQGPGCLAERLDDLAAQVDRCLKTPVPVPTVDE